MTTYSKTSPYAATPVESFFLGPMVYRKIPSLAEDAEMTITDVYEFRPDLLANDLYGESGLWWVFAVRNPGLIEDPVNDFTVGKTIKLPKKSSLITFLGI
jgi:hypothetical protein